MRDWITEGFIRVSDLFDNHGNILSLHAIKDRMPYKTANPSTIDVMVGSPSKKQRVRETCCSPFGIYF